MKVNNRQVGNMLRPEVRCIKCRKRKVRKGGLVWCRTCGDQMHAVLARVAALPLDLQE